VVGQNAMQHERIYSELFAATRPSTGGVIAQALGAIENALLDVKGKVLGVPCYELLGGKIRDRIRVYWSHCATWRINHPSWYKPPIESLDGVKAMGREVREKKFTALKTNIFSYDDGKPTGWRPGFGSPFLPEINVDRKILRDLRMHLEAIRDGAGPDVDILLEFPPSIEGQVNDKKVRIIAASQIKRSPFMPDVPTAAESGVPGYDVSSWNGIFAPQGTPKEVVDTLNKAVAEVVAMPDVKEKFARLGVVAQGSTPDELMGRVKSDITKWSAVITKAGIPKK